MPGSRTASTTAAATHAPARPRAELRPRGFSKSRSRLLAALQDRPELLMRLLQLGCGIGAGQRRSYASANKIAEFGDGNDDGQAQLADLCGIDHRLQPLLRHLHATLDFGIVEDRVAERYAAAGLQQPCALLLRYRPLAEQIGCFLVLAGGGDAK